MLDYIVRCRRAPGANRGRGSTGFPLRECAMLDAAVKALTQMFSPPFRRVLLKSIGLALLMIILVGIGLNRLFSWMADSGAVWE